MSDSGFTVGKGCASIVLAAFVIFVVVPAVLILCGVGILGFGAKKLVESAVTPPPVEQVARTPFPSPTPLARHTPTAEEEAAEIARKYQAPK